MMDWWNWLGTQYHNSNSMSGRRREMALVTVIKMAMNLENALSWQRSSRMSPTEKLDNVPGQPIPTGAITQKPRVIHLELTKAYCIEAMVRFGCGSLVPRSCMRFGRFIEWMVSLNFDVAEQRSWDSNLNFVLDRLVFEVSIEHRLYHLFLGGRFREPLCHRKWLRPVLMWDYLFTPGSFTKSPSHPFWTKFTALLHSY